MKPLEWIKSVDLKTGDARWTLVLHGVSRWPGEGEGYRTPAQWLPDDADGFVRSRAISVPLGTVSRGTGAPGSISWRRWWWVPRTSAATSKLFESATEAMDWAFTEHASRLTQEALAPDDRAYSA